MPRTLGTIIVALAAVVGAGALLLPVPEQIEVQTEEAAPAPKGPRTPAAASRPARKEANAPAAVPPAPAKPAPAAAPRPPFPMQDTTKTRTMVQPKG